MAHPHGSSGPQWGLVIGCTVTLVSCVALPLGLWSRIDDLGLDLHFRHLGAIPADPRIVLIDINDHAIRSFGEWPWPRRRFAQLIRTLDGLGARSVVLDIVFAEPSTPRFPSEAFDFSPAVGPSGNGTVDPVFPSLIRDDDELAEAIAEVGNVYLAMFAPLDPPHVDRSRALTAVIQAMADGPTAESGRPSDLLRRAVVRADGALEIGELMRDGLLGAALMEDFCASAEELERRFPAPAAAEGLKIGTRLPVLKRFVARMLARRFLESQSGASCDEFLRSVMPSERREILGPDHHELASAFRHAAAEAALRRKPRPLPHELGGRVAIAHDATLPLNTFAAGAQGIGFVAYLRATTGGVVRSLPLVVQMEGLLVPQLGAMVALDALGVGPEGVRFSNGKLCVRGGESGEVCLPVSAAGDTVVNWHRPARADRWQDSFEHIPVSRVLEIALNAEAVEQNDARLASETADWVRIRHADTPAEYAAYVELVNQQFAVCRRLGDASVALSESEAASLGEGLDRLRGEMRLIEEEAVLWLRRSHGLWQSEEPRDERERLEKQAIGALFSMFGEGQLARKTEELNQSLLARNAELRTELHPKLKDKFCLVGYTASGVADLITTPVYSSMPGVMAHANVLNMLLQGRPAARARGTANSLLLAGVGLLVTLCAARGRLLTGVAAMLGVSIAALAVGGIWFRASSCYLAAPVAAAQAALVWAFVTAYRQFTEERARRRFQQALAQYTSPAVASRIAVQTADWNLAPRPARVTCFFSDLYGFTELAERLGASRTREVLNPYLEGVSRALVEHGAMVNKFMGDGIFAFFNAPILPCDHPAKAACMAALDSLRALDRPPEPEFERNPDRTAEPAEILRVRIGISTGEAFVGDYGSAAKLDYTCIGDTVNSGARLEAANKHLGTRILVDEATRTEAGNGFVFRPMGRLRLPGRLRPVTAYELVGITVETNGNEREYAERFALVVRHYQDSEWDSCLSKLLECGRIRPTDDAAERYRESASQYRRSAPTKPWNGSLPLPDR